MARKRCVSHSRHDVNEGGGGGANKPWKKACLSPGFRMTSFLLNSYQIEMILMVDLGGLVVCHDANYI